MTVPSAIQTAAVTIINTAGVRAATDERIARAAGLSLAEFSHQIQSTQKLFISIEDIVLSDYLTAVDHTTHRRRSFTASVRIALLSIWRSLCGRLEFHRAVTALELAASWGADDEATRLRLHRKLDAAMEHCLTSLAAASDVTWQEPIDLLARLTRGFLNGLSIGDARSLRNGDTYQTIGTFSYDLARRTKRP